jgi:hypothetical protein
LSVRSGEEFQKFRIRHGRVLDKPEPEIISAGSRARKGNVAVVAIASLLYAGATDRGCQQKRGCICSAKLYGAINSEGDQSQHVRTRVDYVVL